MPSVGPIPSPITQSPAQTTSIASTSRLNNVSGKSTSPAPLGAGDPKGMRTASTNNQPRI